MFKSLVFSALLAYAVAAPMSSMTTAIDRIDQIFQAEDSTPACNAETRRFNACFKDINEKSRLEMFQDVTKFPSKSEVLESVADIRKALKCAGEPVCSKQKLTKYASELVIYAGEKIYGEGFGCVNQNDMVRFYTACVLSEVPMDQLQGFTFKTVLQYAKPVTSCFAKHQECEESEKAEFYKGMMASVELVDIFVPILEAVHSGNLEFIHTFDKKFNPKDLDNLKQ
ncbi:DUF19 domain-containing protein [Caenorhabditis elegans]|uniref:DUF19 domain-containing protein n=1 Tax=Caenorhabditis elegans TaxID=6239 RepID=O18224_CAEEL|nr:DUF19 domain-containing protein [Caenorhabditis elegans]CAB16499.1 DUF19 domain-containing protein [Caenorhabditis elegans]|eukprot:NP_502769.1 Uncharacterized protein CELE_Y57G11B.5 [Caenorhabditis elegans]